MTQPSPELREKIAAIIDPTEWRDDEIEVWGDKWGRKPSLYKADAILKLIEKETRT